MKRSTLLIGLGVLLVVVVLVSVAGVLAYNALLGPTLAPSGELTAIPVVVATATPSAAGANDPTPAADPATEVPAGMLVLNIDPAQSEVSFTIDEELAGSPNTVVGTSSTVAGQIAVDPSDLSTAQIGVIQVDARTFVTDSNQRNGAIRNFILNTDTYEYITFTPTEVRGLSGSAAPGDSLTFQVVGDLTIRDVTQSVTFDVTATADSANQLSGTATTTVQRADFELTIPSVPRVANVSDDVLLTITFVATQAAS
jgi:polyisoprenoid-binding protein YceI